MVRNRLNRGPALIAQPPPIHGLPEPVLVCDPSIGDGFSVQPEPMLCAQGAGWEYVAGGT